MFDIPMKSSGALSLSDLDSSNFAKNAQNGQAPQAQTSTPSQAQFMQQQNVPFNTPQPMPQQQPGFGQQPSVVNQQGFGGQSDFVAQPQQQPGFGIQQQTGFGAQPQQQTGFGAQPGFGGQQINQQQPGFGGQPMQSVPQQPKQRPAGGGVIIKKGQKTSLSQMNPGLDLIEVGLGWDLGPNGQSYDLDVEAFILGQNGRVIGDDWFVFYNQPSSPDGSVRLLSDSTTGAGVGDDEIIQVRLSQVNNQVQKIAFIVTINEAKENGYNFSNVANAYVRIVDKQTNKELVKFQLTEYYNNVCSMVVGELYKHNNEWKFSPIGDGTADDLTGLCVRYGVNIAG